MDLLKILGVIAAVCRFLVTLLGDREDKKAAIELGKALKRMKPDRLEEIKDNLDNIEK